MSVLQLCLLAMTTLSMSLAVTSAVVSWRLASRVTRALSRKPPSESILSKLEVDQAELFSQLGSMATTVKRLSSRTAMQTRRAESASEAERAAAPPVGSTKAELRRHYGLNVAGPEFAKRQLSLVPTPKE